MASLAANPYFSAGFGLVGVGTSLALARSGMRAGWILARRRLLVTLEIPSKDKSHHWVLNYISSQKYTHSQHLSVQTSYRQHSNGSASTHFEFQPALGSHFFRYRNRWIMVNRQRETQFVDLQSGSPWETVTLTAFGKDYSVFSDLLNDAKIAAMLKEEGKTVIYTGWGTEWRPFGLPRRRRPLHSVILRRNMAENISNDVKEFLRSSTWYVERGMCTLPITHNTPRSGIDVLFADRSIYESTVCALLFSLGIPYRRGYLLYGPPGCGKTSFIQALAGELQYDICVLNLSERGMTDDKLNHLLSVAPRRSFILLEDVDAVFTQRAAVAKDGYATSVTFSGLLNALDGVASTEERIVFLTTNHLERLDPALVRPGRVDVKLEVGMSDGDQVSRMFLRFHPDHPGLAETFAHAVLQDRTAGPSMAALQAFFLTRKNSAQQCVDDAHLLR